MQQICPVCNGMSGLSVWCSNCGKVMEDQGHVSDFYGPYSPYEEDYWPQLTGQVGKLSSAQCIHFLFCQGCKRGTKRAVSKITI